VKRDFMGGPIYRALKKLKEGECDESINCEISYRPKETYWLKGDSDKVIVVFSINFEDAIDQSLSRIMLHEMQESRKIVKQSASINYHKDSTKLPPGYLSELGVNPDLANCGLITFTLFKDHLRGGLNGPTFFLQAF
jgi:hypothetical protein